MELLLVFFFFRRKTSYDMRMSDWSSDVCSSDLISPLLGEFHARHPDVRVEMMLSNEQVDLIDKEIDVALRLGSLPDSNLVARKLAVLRTQVYASPAYLERHGEPLHPDDLQHHRTLGRSEERRVGQEGVSTCNTRW